MRGLTAPRLFSALLWTVAATTLSAQQGRRRAQFEGRIDAIGARESSLHVGAGASVPAGTYLRVGAVVGAGVASRDGDSGFSGRIDVLTRFVLDPLLQHRRAPYAAGGVSALYAGDHRGRFVLVFLVGVEGAPRRGVLPAVELGLGGGLRASVVLRQAFPNRR